jgi:dihydroxy-acid dehydratase
MIRIADRRTAGPRGVGQGAGGWPAFVGGRFSGARRGLRGGQVCPEAVAGGPVGLPEDRGGVAIDAVGGRPDGELPDKELAARARSWKPRRTACRSGAVWKCAQTVGPVRDGAVTHPGAASETCYADI